MVSRHNTSRGLLCLLVVATLCGCGGNGRIQLSGNVTFRGQPVPLGRIRIEPDTDKGGRGPGAVASIEAGTYRTEADMGPVPGPNKIFVRGFDGVGAAEKAGGPAPYVGTALFDEYVFSVDLPAHHHRLNIEVPDKASTEKLK